MTDSLPPPVSSSPRRKVRGDILFAFGVVIFLYLAWLTRDVLVLLYASALFAVVLMPVVSGVRRLRIGRWHPSHGLAIFIIMVLLVGAIACFSIFTLPPLIHEVTTFIKSVPGRIPAMQDKLTRIPLMRHIDLSVVLARLQLDTTQHLGSFVASVGDWATKLFAVFTGIVLTVYFLAEGEHVYRWFLSLVPLTRREQLDETLQRAAARMGRWLLGQLVLMLILAVCSGIVFGVMHLRYAFALAVLMGAFNIVPVVGAFISTSIVMIFAAGDSWEKVVGVLIFELVYAQIESALLTPRIMKSSVDLAGTAVFIALLLGGSLAGILGVLVAVPSAVLAAVLIEEYVIRPAEVPRPPNSAVTPVGK